MIIDYIYRPNIRDAMPKWVSEHTPLMIICDDCLNMDYCEFKAQGFWNETVLLAVVAKDAVQCVIPNLPTGIIEVRICAYSIGCSATSVIVEFIAKPEVIRD